MVAYCLITLLTCWALPMHKLPMHKLPMHKGNNVHHLTNLKVLIMLFNDYCCPFNVVCCKSSATYVDIYIVPWRRTYCNFRSSTWMMLFMKLYCVESYYATQRSKEVTIITWHLKYLLVVFIWCLYVWNASHYLCTNLCSNHNEVIVII